MFFGYVFQCYSSNRRLIFSLVLCTKQLLVIYILHSVINSWYNCNRSKNNDISVLNAFINFVDFKKVKTDHIFLSLFFRNT